MSGRFPAENDENTNRHGRQRSNVTGSLTPDELRALKECSTESFWYRCLPLGAVFVSASQLMVNRGVLKPHPRFGALFKNMAAGLIGYFVGKISYQSECRRKILSLENSPLAEALRHGKRGLDVADELYQQHQMQPSGTSYKADPIQLRGEGHIDTDIDVDSNVRYAGLDDSQRPSMDTLDSDMKRNLDKLQDSDRSSGVDYSELRRRNREEFERRNAPPQASTAPQSARRSAVQEPYRAPSGIRRNQYGDVIED